MPFKKSNSHEQHDSDIRNMVGELERIAAERKQNQQLEALAEKNEEAEFYASKPETISGAVDTRYHTLLERLGHSFSWLLVIFTIILLPINIYRMIHAALVRKENDKIGRASRSVQFLSGLGGVVLGLLSIVVTAGVLFIATPILLLAGAVKSCLENIWNLGHAIYERVTKGQKINAEIKRLQDSKQPNASNQSDILIRENRKLNLNVADKTNSLIISVVAIIATALLFTPAAPVAFFMIIGLAAYSVISAVAFHWASKKINGNENTSKNAQATGPNEIKEEARLETGSNKPKPKLSQAANLQVNTLKGNAIKNHNTETDIFTRISKMMGLGPSKLAQKNVEMNKEMDQEINQKEINQKTAQTPDSTPNAPVSTSNAPASNAPVSTSKPNSQKAFSVIGRRSGNDSSMKQLDIQMQELGGSKREKRKAKI